MYESGQWVDIIPETSGGHWMGGEIRVGMMDRDDRLELLPRKGSVEYEESCGRNQHGLFRVVYAPKA